MNIFAILFGIIILYYGLTIPDTSYFNEFKIIIISFLGVFIILFGIADKNIKEMKQMKTITNINLSEFSIVELREFKKCIEDEIKIKEGEINTATGKLGFWCKAGLHSPTKEISTDSVPGKSRTLLTHKVCMSCGKHIYNEFYVPDL